MCLRNTKLRESWFQALLQLQSGVVTLIKLCQHFVNIFLAFQSCVYPKPAPLLTLHNNNILQTWNTCFHAENIFNVQNIKRDPGWNLCWYNNIFFHLLCLTVIMFLGAFIKDIMNHNKSKVKSSTTSENGKSYFHV